MKKFILGVAVAALATMAVASSASAGVERYQTQSGTLTVNMSNGNLHTFDVVVSPCDNSFTGTGVSDQPGYHFTETIKGSLSGGQFAFEATFTGLSAVQFPGYKWGTVSPGTLGAWIPGKDSLGDAFQLTATLGTLAKSNWKNHGEYVKAQGGGSEAAHSCIGMPIN